MIYNKDEHLFKIIKLFFSLIAAVKSNQDERLFLNIKFNKTYICIKKVFEAKIFLDFINKITSV